MRETEMSRRGIGFVAANGSGIKSYGEKKIVGYMRPVRLQDRVTEENPRGTIPRYQMTSWAQYDMAMEALKLRNKGRGKRKLRGN